MQLPSALHIELGGQTVPVPQSTYGMEVPQLPWQTPAVVSQSRFDGHEPHVPPQPSSPQLRPAQSGVQEHWPVPTSHTAAVPSVEHHEWSRHLQSPVARSHSPPGPQNASSAHRGAQTPPSGEAASATQTA